MAAKDCTHYALVQALSIFHLTELGRRCGFFISWDKYV